LSPHPSNIFFGSRQNKTEIEVTKPSCMLITQRCDHRPGNGEGTSSGRAVEEIVKRNMLRLINARNFSPWQLRHAMRRLRQRARRSVFGRSMVAKCLKHYKYFARTLTRIICRNTCWDPKAPSMSRAAFRKFFRTLKKRAGRTREEGGPQRQNVLLLVALANANTTTWPNLTKNEYVQRGKWILFDR